MTPAPSASPDLSAVPDDELLRLDHQVCFSLHAASRAFGGYYRLLVNKYYIDELYDHRFVDAAKAFAGAAWAFDIHIIDGFANRLGWLVNVGGAGLRLVQTGVVGNYALSIMAGLLFLMALYGGYAAGMFGR